MVQCRSRDELDVGILSVDPKMLAVDIIIAAMP